MAERFLKHEVTFSLRCKTLIGRCKRIKRCMASRRSAYGIPKTEENAGGTAMTKKINWQKKLLESRKFNDKFSKNLLEHGEKNFMQGIFLGYMYSRWRKVRGLDKDDPAEK